MQIPKPTPEQVMEALLDGNNDLFLLDNLIATGYAAFTLLQTTHTDNDIKSAFHQLEQRFKLYARLVGGDRALNLDDRFSDDR